MINVMKFSNCLLLFLVSLGLGTMAYGVNESDAPSVNISVSNSYPNAIKPSLNPVGWVNLSQVDVPNSISSKQTYTMSINGSSTTQAMRFSLTFTDSAKAANYCTVSMTVNAATNRIGILEGAPSGDMVCAIKNTSDGKVRITVSQGTGVGRSS